MRKLFTGLMTLFLAATLVACGGSSRDTTLLRVGSGKDFADPDPAIVDDSVTANVLAQAYEGLYKLDGDGKVGLALATAMPEISADGLTYTIKMREDAKWSDGKPVTAKDFEYSIKRASITKGYYTQFIYQFIKGAGKYDETIGAYGPYDTMDQVKDAGVVALDDYTLQITLNEKSAYYTSLLTNTTYYPVRQDIVEKDGANPAESKWATKKNVPTNGPFRMESVKVKDEIILKKNKEYYDAKEVKLETVSFKNIPDMDTQVSAFQSGELDFATSVNNETITSDESLQEDVYVIDPFVCNYYILINAGNENKNPVLKDENVRKGLLYGVDRKAMLKVLGKGDLAYELHGMIPVGIPGVDGDFREEADESGKYAYYDLEKAKGYMEAAGYNKDNRLKLTFTSNDNTMHKTVVQSLQESLKKVYIDLSYQSMDGEAFFAARDEGTFEDVCRHAMTADFLDPMGYLSMNYGPSTLGNTTDDATFEAMIDEANKLDGKERMTKLHEAEKYLVEEKAYIIPLFGYVEPYLKAPDLKGITSSPEGHYNLSRAYYE